jgi:hypothetical protein
MLAAVPVMWGLGIAAERKGAEGPAGRPLFSIEGSEFTVADQLHHQVKSR